MVVCDPTWFFSHVRQKIIPKHLELAAASGCQAGGLGAFDALPSPSSTLSSLDPFPGASPPAASHVGFRLQHMMALPGQDAAEAAWGVQQHLPGSSGDPSPTAGRAPMG